MRSDFLDDNGICKEQLSITDGLPVRCVGGWAKKKIYILNRYFDIFSKSMRNKWKLNYIEICSGPGKCIDKDTGQEFDGTPLSILNIESIEFIKNALFLDIDDKVISILNKRIELMGKSNIAKAIKCDYNDNKILLSILNDLPQNALNLIFLDPTDCSIPFSLIESINKVLNNTDFIVNTAFGTDLKRNLRKAIHNKHYDSRNKYLNFLGSNDFFDRPEVIKIAQTETPNVLLDEFFKEYKNNLSKLNLKYTAASQIKHFYYLFFASKHPLGLKFWSEANHIDSNGQSRLRL